MSVLALLTLALGSTSALGKWHVHRLQKGARAAGRVGLPEAKPRLGCLSIVD